MSIKHPLLVLCVLLLASSVKAQQWDFATWHSLKANGELVKDLGLSIEQQLRFRNNSTAVEATFTELGLSYDLPKGFALAAAYRLSWSPDRNAYYESQHRYNIDLSYGRDFWNLKAKLRARFQHRPSPSYFNERLKPDDSPIFIRLKLSVSYRKWKDWKPGLEFETFVRTDNPNQLGAKRFRYRVFLDYDLPKRQELGLFYMLETDYFGETPLFQSVVGVSYSYEWKRPKTKKKDKKEDK